MLIWIYDIALPKLNLATAREILRGLPRRTAAAWSGVARLYSVAVARIRERFPGEGTVDEEVWETIEEVEEDDIPSLFINSHHGYRGNEHSYLKSCRKGIQSYFHDMYLSLMTDLQYQSIIGAFYHPGILAP